MAVPADKAAIRAAKEHIKAMQAVRRDLIEHIERSKASIARSLERIKRIDALLEAAGPDHGLRHPKKNSK